MRNSSALEGLTAGKTGITSIEGLRNSRIAQSPYASEFADSDALLEVHGIDTKTEIDYTMVGRDSDAWAEINLGRMDALWQAINARLLKTQEEVGEVVILPITAEKLAQGIAEYPLELTGAYTVMLTDDTVPGLRIKGPLPVVGYDTILWTNSDLPEDVGYTILKTLFEHLDEVQQINPRIREWNPEWAIMPADVAKDLPYSAGSIKAFKEYGVWTPEHEIMQIKALLK